jgi:deoxyribonuclease V
MEPAWWEVTPAQAIELQRQWASRVERQRRVQNLRSVAGVDAAYRGGRVRAAVAVFSFPELELVQTAIVEQPVRFPYVPGLLSFREAPAIVSAIEQLPFLPDILLCDGQGIAHPRRFGIASHLGVLLDLPSVGCAKSLLCGQYQEPIGVEAGSAVPVYDRGELVAQALRTRTGVRPVFVSIGHRVDLDFACWLVLQCCRGFRLPEPIRWADRLSRGEHLRERATA